MGAQDAGQRQGRSRPKPGLRSTHQLPVAALPLAGSWCRVLRNCCGGVRWLRRGATWRPLPGIADNRRWLPLSTECGRLQAAITAAWPRSGRTGWSLVSCRCGCCSSEIGNSTPVIDQPEISAGPSWLDRQNRGGGGISNKDSRWLAGCTSHQRPHWLAEAIPIWTATARHGARQNRAGEKALASATAAPASALGGTWCGPCGQIAAGCERQICDSVWAGAVACACHQRPARQNIVVL